jgi:membrane carboxypeptidase/penicillin-binding protein
MGNPLRKESLGSGMTGGHGAVPYFNAFMIPFMKGKPIESFPAAPPMPAEIKREMELRKREELEKLEEADIAGRKTGITFSPGTKIDPDAPLPGDKPATDTDVPAATTKPLDTTPDKPIVVRPIQPPPTPRSEPTPEKPAGPKPKGKKGDG